MNVIGIDVSKAKLDCAWLREDDKVKAKAFPNAAVGWKGLLEWSLNNTGLAAGQLYFVMDDCMDAGGRAMREQLPKPLGFTTNGWPLSRMMRERTAR